MTNEYICKQDAVEAVDRIFDNVPMELTTEILQLRRELRELPSADVVPVIRCKECMHYVQETPYRGYCTDTHSFGRYWRPDDFCSYGEREE